MAVVYSQCSKGSTCVQAESPMEFACGFVYVPPAANQKDVQRSNPNVLKRSALLPPINRMRPSNPPPPPPTNSAEAKTTKSAPTAQKFIEHLEKKEEVKKDVKPSPFYENVEFHLKAGAASSVDTPPQQITPPRRTALLPPHMRPAAKSPPYSQPLPSSDTNSQTFNYDLPKEEPDMNADPWDPNYSYNIPEGSGGEVKLPVDTSDSVSTQKAAPPLPPRPSFMTSVPEYLVLLPSSRKSSSSSQKSPSASPLDSALTGSADKGPLPGNPNVILVSLGKLLSEERALPIHGEPTSCSQCGSVLDSCYDNVVNVCNFCEPCEETSKPRCPPNGYQDGLFLLRPDEELLSPADALLLFCIDISGSMSITSQVSEGEQVVYRSRLQFVQDAVLQCVQKLSQQHPDKRVGLITFNHQVTIHGYEDFTSCYLSDAELIDSEYLKAAAFSLPSPPPLSRTKDCLQREVLGLSESGATALGPAALLAVAMASRQPGSKMGRPTQTWGIWRWRTTTLAPSSHPPSSTRIWGNMLPIREGTDCRLDELGRLADRTGGKVVIASPHQLHPEFEQIIENRTIATHCSVTLLLPKTLRVRGEREAGHRATREVGNVAPDTEITFQFGANEQDSEVSAPASGSRVCVQLQIRYRQRDGQTLLRVLTADREVTDDSSAALSSLSLAIVQLNSSQASAALAVRGRFLDARGEGEAQRNLIERAIEHNRSAEDKQTYQEWVKTMEPIYNNIHNYTRRKSVISDSQSLTDMGAALLYNMKHSNRKSISLKDKHKA
uniref:circularly permutated Ras protein 1-like isoform X2 n=1 Tax=Centroberyx gerrardi TaxID=166262 RepID=UPI003AACD8FA